MGALREEAAAFVMTEDTEAANQIANCLNRDPLYTDLNGRVFNLHTRLKGRVKWIGGRQHGNPLANGELVTVARVAKDGRTLAANYRQFVRGYAPKELLE